MRADSVVFYTRGDCPLCLAARDALVAAGIEFREVDITGEPGLLGEYGNLVPVVEVEGVVVFEGGMDPTGLPDLIFGRGRPSLP